MDHLVQLSGADDALLVHNVARYLRDGFTRGGGAILIAPPARRAALIDALAKLGIDQAARERVVELDAAETLAGLMAGDGPNRARFQEHVGSRVRALSDRGELRTYGEMVGLLWARGELSAAIALEGFWNELQGSVRFDLFCSYPIDLQHATCQVTAIDAVLAPHSRVVSGATPAFQTALERALADVLGDGFYGLRTLAGRQSARSRLPPAERTILWLRAELPRHADEVIERARTYAVQ